MHIYSTSMHIYSPQACSGKFTPVHQFLYFDRYSNPPLPGTPTPLSQVLQRPSPRYSNAPLPGTPTPLSQVLQPYFDSLDCLPVIPVSAADRQPLVRCAHTPILRCVHTPFCARSHAILLCSHSILRCAHAPILRCAHTPSCARLHAILLCSYSILRSPSYSFCFNAIAGLPLRLPDCCLRARLSRPSG